ncbi:MAG: trypsin-like serine protease [Planctomycetota bacterium]|jgi:hypothetical protein
MHKLDYRIFLLVLAALATPVLAQSTLDWPVGEFRPYRLESGGLGNLERSSSVAYQAAVTIEDAIWLRLYFENVELDDGSFIRMTSALDGEVQELDAAGIAMWKNSSAYFNGDTVYLELIAGPETTDNRVVLDRVAVELADGSRACGANGCGYCSGDDRVPSAEFWTGRLMPVGCTGSVYNEESCVVTAGHCAGGNLTMQFNVPDSQSNCNTVNPPVADQFPIIAQQFNNGGVGDDWAVMMTGTNNLGERPYDRYGVLRPIATDPATAGNPVTVWGYGVDDSPSPTRNQTQQTDSGTISSRFDDRYTFFVDITFGNSGSALMRNGEIIGIVTHCPCPNTATRIDLATFEEARQQLCPGPLGPDPMSFFIPPSGANTSAVIMVATTATGGIPPSPEYFFDFVSGGSGGDDSGWQTVTGYTDDGLQTNTTYTYRVKARDGDTPPTETGYSPSTLTATRIETPTGLVIGTATTDSIELSASGTFTNLTAGSSGIYFDSTTAGGNGGINEWLQITTDTATGLTPDTMHDFQVRARNQIAVATPYTSAVSKATLANVPAAPVLTVVDCNSMDIDVAPDGNPAITTYAILGSETSPHDAAWDGMYVDATGNPSATPVYQTAADWETTVAVGLAEQNSYTFDANARNQEGVETAPGPQATAATPECSVLGDGDFDFDGDRDIFDFAAFQACFGQMVGPGCEPGNMAGDNMIGLDDYEEFYNGLTGPL